MKDMNDQIEDRWRSRRKKGYNWPKLIAMVLILVALWYASVTLKRMGDNQTMIMTEETDSLSTPAGQAEPNP
ncbi:MAG: hypothetical protein RBQ67_04155 [Candidatus Cloacimonadaceae bacterium]|nr:hypothetical protein [Candidatus Cloacimonadota bacterium]MDY0319163.1 hypothetical protein [Candidatus Cloacimonadaceae bacterium]HQB98325.1 hypothetical protein [Candidatus Cloacimonadota bacterium]